MANEEIEDDAPGPPRPVVPITGAVIQVPIRSRRNWTEEDTKNADEMGERVPEHLYRYVKLRDRSTKPSRRLRGYVKATVKGSTLHFSNYADLNDPFEGSFDISDILDANPETKTAYWAEVAQEQRKSRAETEATISRMLNLTPEQAKAFEKTVKGNFLELGLCCFTGSPKDLLAWSYYAGGHGGLCLRFRMETLFRSLGQSPGMLLEVQYRKDHPSEPFYQPGKFNMMLAALCTKAKMWEHEREWRIVLRKSGEVDFPQEVSFPSDALDGIVMGCRITPEDERFVRGLVEGRVPPIRLLRAIKKENEYAVQIVDA